MNICISNELFDLDHLQFCNKKENNVIQNGFFHKIKYTLDCVTVNNLYIAFNNLKEIRIFEENIIKKFNSYQEPQFVNHRIYNNKLIIKYSGLWYDNNKIGLAYKVVH